MKTILFSLFLGISLGTFGQDQYLKDHYKFPIGASMNPRLLAENDAYRKLASTEFNSVTAENHMKMVNIHPEKDRFDFSKGDEIIGFAQSTGSARTGRGLSLFVNCLMHWATCPIMSLYSGPNEQHARPLFERDRSAQSS